VRISHGAVIGTEPQDLKYAGEPTETHIGDRTIIRECATVHRGTIRTGRTIVGADCMIMAYAHVAHDNTLGHHVILANAVQLGGHVTLEDWVVVGGASVVHQFCRIGMHAMIGGGFRVTQDVLPFVIVGGCPARTLKLNRIGLERRGLPAETIERLSRAFRIVFRSKRNFSQAADELQRVMPDCPEAQQMRDFILQSERGLVR
jgi:UDP-N-acetylglucosamine acyltransferase